MLLRGGVEHPEVGSQAQQGIFGRSCGVAGSDKGLTGKTEVWCVWRHQAGGDEQWGKTWMALWELKRVTCFWLPDPQTLGDYESQEWVNSLLVLFSVTS